MGAAPQQSSGMPLWLDVRDRSRPAHTVEDLLQVSELFWRGPPRLPSRARASRMPCLLCHTPTATTSHGPPYELSCSHFGLGSRGCPSLPCGSHPTNRSIALSSTPITAYRRGGGLCHEPIVVVLVVCEPLSEPPIVLRAPVAGVQIRSVSSEPLSAKAFISRFSPLHPCNSRSRGSGTARRFLRRRY
jgi:hypothetical protein